MCGIIGIFGDENAVSLIEQGLILLRERGRDAQGIFSHRDAKEANSTTVSKRPWAIGHTLHAVVHHVAQPIHGKGTLVANCEVYNWKQLNKRFALNTSNDAHALLALLDAMGINALDELDGVYSFAYLSGQIVTIARDLLGVKPLWYSYTTDHFAFCSEKKVLESLGFADIRELHPRHVMQYNISNNTVQTRVRDFFTHLPMHTEAEVMLKNRTEQLLNAAIEKRVPNQKFGVLFSGGIDSTYIANHLQKQGHEFTCYTAALESPTPAQDLVWARRVAKELGLNLKVKTVTLDDIPHYLKRIVPLIEDSNVVKVGVALTFYLACELAKKDGCKVIFSGLGSEEIFAGYERHRKATDVNKECVYGLMKMYERDLYRDDVITMSHNLEVRLPFLDKELVDYALKIPPSLKISKGVTKRILRDLALSVGLSKDISFRKKTAAQYGSRIDSALGKLAKRDGKTKSEYTRSFYPSHNVKLGVLFSGGKDSTYAAYIMNRQNYPLTCLITMRSRNPESYMFHTPAIEMTSLQAKAMGIALIVQETSGEKETELNDLEAAMRQAKETYGIEGIVTGALFSTYQRDRIEKICEKLGLKVFAPLWHKPQQNQMQELINSEFVVVLTAIAGEGLDKSWLGRPITQEDIDTLGKMHRDFGFNVAGEGGEFESLVVDCPLFEKKIVFDYDLDMESIHTGRITIKDAQLVDHSR